MDGLNLGTPSGRHKPPTPYQIQQAMAVANAVKVRIVADDPEAAEDQQLIADMIDGETNALDIVRALIRFSIESGSLADAAKERMEALKHRRDRFLQRSETARNTALAMLNALECGKLEEPDFTASITKGRPKLVTTGEPPDAFARVTREWDKVAAKAAIEAGQNVEGAMLSNSPPSLTIRTK